MSNKTNYYKHVFVVLTYRNTKDLVGFLDSLEKCVESYKVIIVNSFYDDKSRDEFENIAVKHGCDFINVPNKGYSSGNNRGIDYAKEKYEFDYLIISNPDIIVKKFLLPEENQPAIYCGKITTLSGKLQNPMHVVENKLSEYFVYKGMKKNNKFLFYSGITISKIFRTMFNLKIKISHRERFKIFAAHGSFFVFSRKAVEVIKPAFDEKMFLFSEEHVLAKRAKKQNIPIYYLKSVECIHKEDGSMNLWNGNINEELKKSVIYCYESYVLQKKRG